MKAATKILIEMLTGFFIIAVVLVGIDFAFKKEKPRNEKISQIESSDTTIASAEIDCDCPKDLSKELEKLKAGIKKPTGKIKLTDIKISSHSEKKEEKTLVIFDDIFGTDFVNIIKYDRRIYFLDNPTNFFLELQYNKKYNEGSILLNYETNIFKQ